MKRLVRRLIRLFPDAFRKRYGDELAEFLDLRAAEIRKSSGTFGVARFWIINTFDLLRTAMAERSLERRQRPPLQKGDGFMNSRLGIRQALHSFRHRRAFAAIAIASLGIGIGANLAVFSVASRALLDALPYKNPQELFMVWGRVEQTGLSRRLVSPANYQDLEQENTVFEAMGAYTEQFFNFAPDDRNGTAQRLGGVSANPGFLKALGVQPIVGRALRADDALRSSGEGPLAILVSHRLWKSRFGADDLARARRVSLNGRDAEVVGVLPPGFYFLDNDMDFIAPLWSPEQLSNWRRRRYLTVVARLKDGVRVDKARAEMELIFARLADTYPDANGGRTVDLLSLDKETRGSAWPVIMLLQGVSLFVLLIAAANVSSFQITGLLSRAREFSTRAALGATRRQLVQQVLNESLLLGTMGGALGVALAATSTRLLTAAIPIDIPGIESAVALGIDARVLLGACVLTAIAGMAAGALPAVYASNFDLRTSLRGGGQESVSRPRRRAQELLVAVGVAVTFMLLLATGLAVKSLMLIQRVDPGFTARSETVAMDLSLDRRYVGLRAQFFENLLERIQAQPGVHSAGVTTHLPLSRESGERTYSLVPDSSLFEQDKPFAEYRRVSERYFDAMGMTLRRGRGFSSRDMQEPSTAVVIINTALAERHWPGEDPIGRRLMIDHGIDQGSTIAREVIGVVADVRHFGRERAVRPELYIPHVDRPWPHMTLVVRATGANAASLVEQARTELGELDRTVPVSNVKTLDDYISASSGARRFSRNLIGGYGAVALLLSSLGIFGIVAHTVGQRKREFAIRSAVGAEERHVLTLVLRDGLRVIGFGLAVGSVGAAALAPLVAGMVYGVELLDMGAVTLQYQ